MAKKPPATRNADMARRIWLAGIGAYGKAFSEAQENLAKMSGETSRVFEDLVAKGETIEQAVEEKGRKIAKNVSASSFSVDERIRKMRTRLGLDTARDGGVSENADALEERLSAIEEKLDLILARIDSAKPARKRAAPKKKSG